MEVQFSPEVEAEIIRRATTSEKDPVQIVRDIVAKAIAEEAEFFAAVQVGLDQAERGELLEHEEVIARIDRRLHPKA